MKRNPKLRRSVVTQNLRLHKQERRLYAELSINQSLLSRHSMRIRKRHRGGRSPYQIKTPPPDELRRQKKSRDCFSRRT